MEATQPRPLLLTAILAITGCTGCQPAVTPQPKVPPDQELQLTMGGFLPNGPEDEKVDGICSPGPTRSALECDIHNGLPNWRLTKVTFVVTWAPYGDDDKKYYRVPISIEPLATAHCTFSLAAVLPSDDIYPNKGRAPTAVHHWGWSILTARGRPVK